MQGSQAYRNSPSGTYVLRHGDWDIGPSVRLRAAVASGVFSVLNRWVYRNSLRASDLAA